MFYFGTIFGLFVGFALMFVFKWQVLVHATTRLTLTVQNSLIDRVMAAPVNLFYDVTPIGKLLNRFSNDIKTLQWGIMHDFWAFVVVIQSVIITFGVAIFVMDKIVVI